MAKGSQTLENFAKTETARKLLVKNGTKERDLKEFQDKIEAGRKKFPEWYAKNEIALNAKLANLQSWVNLDKTASAVLEESQARNQKYYEHWESVAAGRIEGSLDDVEDRKSGLAQRSANLLRAKIQKINGVIRRLGNPHFSCAGKFK